MRALLAFEAQSSTVYVRLHVRFDDRVLFDGLDALDASQDGLPALQTFVRRVGNREQDSLVDPIIVDL